MKIKAVFMSILILIMLSTSTSEALSEPLIKVGLIFGSANQHAISIASESGFTFGELNAEGQFVPIMDMSDYPEFKVVKSGYFSYSKGGEAELSTNAAQYYSNGDVLGGHHLSLGTVYESYEQAFNALKELKLKNTGFFLAYENGWKIYIGAYVTAQEASADLALVEALIPGVKVDIVMPSPGRIIITQTDYPVFAYDSTERDFMFSAPLFVVNQTIYRNGFSILRKANSDLTLINRLSMSHYLYGVLPKEMNGEWHIEALKAQAIAARNYALQNLNKYAHFGFDVSNTVSSQVYGGYTAEHANSNRAVDETQGLLLYHGEQLVQCYYHANSGGITELSGNVWSTHLPYLNAKFDPFSIGASHTDWTAKMSAVEIQEKLSIAGYQIGNLKTIRILERSLSGRVTLIQFIGTSSVATLAKDLPRRVFGASLLKSMFFSLDDKNAVTDIPVAFSTPKRLMPLNGIVSGEGVNYKVQNNVMMVASASRGNYNEDFDKWRYLNNAPFDVNSNDAVYAVKEEISVGTEGIVLYGHGFGHGVGLSQWGAKKMAELGYTFDAILRHYFDGSYVKKMY